MPLLINPLGEKRNSPTKAPGLFPRGRTKKETLEEKLPIARALVSPEPASITVKPPTPVQPTIVPDWDPTKTKSSSEALAAISRIDASDPEYGAQLYGILGTLTDTPGTQYYNPYTLPTNKVALGELSKLGIDTTNVNADWFKQNAGLKQYLQVGIDGTPVKGKTKESKAAYYAYKVEIDEENTQMVEQAWDAAKRDIAYWTGRTDLNLSDEEILAKVDIPKNYKVLTQLDESRTSGSLFELNRPVEYSQDALLGVIWSARSGQTSGSAMSDAVMYQLGNGKQYQDDPAKRSARDPASKTYNPYLLGSTLDEEAAYFGVPAFDKAWLDENLPKVMAGTDDDAKQLIQNVYNAEENTRMIEDAAATFNKANIDSWASFGARQGMDAKAVLAAYFTEDFAPLGKLSESLERRQPLGLTRAVNFDYHGALAKLDKAIADKKLPIPEQAEQRKADVIAKDGDATQPETVPETAIDKASTLPWWAQGFKDAATFLMGLGGQEIAPPTPVKDAFPTEEQPAAEPPAKSQTIPGMKGTMAAAGATDVPLKDGFASSTVDEKRKELDALEAQLQDPQFTNPGRMNVEGQRALAKAQARVGELRDEIRVGERKESQTALMTLAIPEKYTPKGKSEVARAREYAKTTKAPLDQVSQNFKEQIPAIVIEQALLMNEDDARRYEYIYETKGRDAAELFLEGIGAKYLNADVAKAEQESAAKYGKDMPILSTIGSVAGGAFANPTEAIQVYWDRMIVGKDLVENDPRLSTTRRVGTIRESVSEDFSDFGKFVYNTGLSIAENLGTRMLGPASLLAMGLSGAASTMESVMARGGSSEQAYALGTVSLLVETITEKLQFERFTAGMKPGIGGSLKSNVYNYLVGGIKSALPEAGEELVSGAATTVAELMLLGEKSTVWLTYEDAKAGYLKNNMSPEEADNLAWIDACKATGADILLGAAAGGLSGLAFGDIAVFVNQRNGSLAQKAATQTGTQLAAETDPDTQTALALQLTVQAMNANGDVSALETQAAATLGLDLKTVENLGKLAGGKPVGFVGALRILADPKTKRDRIIASALKASGADVAALTRINLIANTLSPETQNPKVDEALSTALKASVQTAAGTDIDLEFTLQRWGQKGLLYLDTLLKSGLEGAREAAVALQSLPSYAQAVVVAERNLQRMTVSPEDIQLQLKAYNWDLGTPELVDNAVERATEQAVESLTDAALAAMQDPVTEAEQLQGIQTAERNVAITANDVAMARQGVDGAWAAAEEADAAFSQTPGDQRLLSQAEAALTEATKAEADLVRAQDSARAAMELHEKLTTDYDLKKIQQRQEAEAQARDQVAMQREAAKPAADAEAAYRAALEGMNNGTGSMEEVNTTLAAWNEARGITTEQTPAEQAPLQDLDTEADIYLEKMMPDASEEDRAEARAMFKEKMEARLGKPQAQEPLFGEKSVKFAQKASKKFGITFISDPDVKGVEEAYWDPTDNSIHLNPNATRGDALVGIAMHELTHAAETSGWYGKLSDTVLGILYNGDEAAQERDITAKIDRYKRAGKTLTVEGALQEIVAQGIRNKVFDSEESINRFLDMDVTLGQKILEVFNRVIATFKGDGEADLLKARSLLEKALKDRAQPTESSEDGVRYSLVEDEDTLSFLNNQEPVMVYRAMQLIDGELYPPMAAKVKPEEGGKAELQTPSQIGAWERSNERPDLIDKDGKFKLDKANKSSVLAAYNPYFHTSASPLNDQFSSAYKRPNLVVVEGAIPQSELTSGYQAQYAKDPVGQTTWHSGPVATQLKGDKARKVFLSRWFKPLRIVSDAEVASTIATTLEGENIEIPYNVVTPTLAAELKNQGVRVSSAENLDAPLPVAESVRKYSLNLNTIDYAMDTVPDEDKPRMTTFRDSLIELGKLQSMVTAKDFQGAYGKNSIHNVNKWLADNPDAWQQLNDIQNKLNAAGIPADFVTPVGQGFVVEGKAVAGGMKGIPIEYVDAPAGNKKTYKFEAFKRSITQMVLDNIGSNTHTRELLRQPLVAAVRENYQKERALMAEGYNPKDPIVSKKELEAAFPGLAEIKKILGAGTIQGLPGRTDFGAQYPMRQAEKTMVALNLNSACPMFTIGNHGCYLDSCYLTQMGNGATGTNLFQTAWYTSEMLQISDETIAEWNARGGIRMNGVGDTLDTNRAQIQDFLQDCATRGAKVKIITKQAVTFDIVNQMRQQGLDTSYVTIQPSLDNLWLPVELDDVYGAAMRGISKLTGEIKDAGDYEGIAEAYDTVNSRATMIKDGQVYRKYGFSREQYEEIRAKYPELTIVPRYVVMTAHEIAEIALNRNGTSINDGILIQTLMHGKPPAGVYGEYGGEVLNFASIRDGGEGINFGGARHIIEKVDGKWQFYGVNIKYAKGSKDIVKTKSRNQTGYRAVQDFVEQNYTPAEQETIWTNLERQLCCQENDFKDACAGCQSYCAGGCSNNAIAPKVAAYEAPALQITGSSFPTFGQGLGAASRQSSLSDDNSADMDAYIESLIGRYGALPQGETPVDTTQLPARTEDGKKVRRFARTVSESGVLTPEQQEEFKAQLVDGAYSYDPISDAVALDAADKLAQRGGADAMQQAWTQALTDNKTPGKMAVAVGERLLQEYANTNDTEGAMRMTAELAEVMTHAGQTVQAARLLKKMTGAGRLYYLQRSVNRVNRNNKTNIELNPDLATDLLNAKDEAGRNAAVEALSKDAGQQLPPNWKSRLDAWRYFAMLGNPRTHIRNLVGNAVFMPAVKIKNMIGAGLEVAKGAERTKSLVLNRSLLKAARADAEANLGMLTSGGKYNPTDDIEQYRPSFGKSAAGRALEGVTQMNMRALEAEDAIFLKRHYANALAGYLQANKLTIETADKKTLDKARQYAVEEAKKATYRDASTLATTLNQISKKGGIAGLVIEGVLPFKKTPMNILKRGVEYSPIGLIDGFTRGLKQYKSGKITQTQLIDKISAGMTGTMIAALGAFLASTGALKVGFKDDKEDRFRRNTGSQEYAIEIFGQSITLDWMTPSSMPLFVGATLFNMAEQGIDPENAFKEVTGALSEIMEPVFNLTMLDGVSSAIEAASWSQEDPITAMFVNSMANYAGQYVPTLGGQIARTIDPIRRKAYTDKNSPLPNVVQQMLGKAANKIPGLASKSEPYLDIWGKEEVSKSPVMRAFENFLSPAYINELTPDAVETMLSEVYKLTQDPSVLPATASKYFTVNGERIDLNGPQYTQYTKTRGETMYTTMDSLLKNETFQGLEPRLKAATLAKVITYANEVGKAALSDFELGTTMSTIAKSSDPGQAVIDQVLQKEQADAQSSYKIAALDSVSTGDAESLSATYGALDQWYRAKYPDYTDKKIHGAIAEYLNAGSNIKKMYIAAYDEGDDDLMAQIEETLASVGIKYNYTSWMMKP